MAYKTGNSSAYTAANTVVTGGVMPDTNAAIDMQATDKGFLIPRMSTAQRDILVPPPPGWDLSNVVYSGTSMDVNPEVADNGTGSFMQPDGTQYFVVDFQSDDVYAYTLSTPFDLSTGSYSGSSFNVTPQTNAPDTLLFDPSGILMYVGRNAVVYKYTLGTPWSITTATFTSSITLTAAGSVAVDGLNFSDDGTLAYVTDNFTDRVHQFALATPWDMLTATYDSKFLDLLPFTGGLGSATSVAFKPDGLVGFITDANFSPADAQVRQFDFSVAWDISTGVDSGIGLMTDPQGTEPYGLQFNTIGNVLYLLDKGNRTVYQYDIV